jgi:D-alanine-D-alanine ligase
MSKIAVIAGGFSDERAVSLRSGAAVASALTASGHEVTQLDLPQKLDDFEDSLAAYDVVFPVLHGKGGEDGVLQAWLEAHNVKYVGPDAKSSELCFDKWRYNEFLAKQNILIPKSEMVSLETWQASPLVKAPFVLKPNDGGSSIDTFIISDPAGANHEAIEAALSRHSEMLLQMLVVGTEITIGVLLEEALPVIEIIPPAGLTFDYENKYNGATQELCPPQNVSAGLQQKSQALALQIHKLTGCRDFSRTDIIISNDQLYVLETNTIPGMTEQSLLPKAAATAGYTMPVMVDRLVKAALAR